MGRSRQRKARLKVIEGGLQKGSSFGTLEIVAAPADRPPFKVDARVVEEDTFLVMSADLEVREPPEPMMKIMTRLLETQPEMPGSVRIQTGPPLKLLAVVHDFNQEPSWREAWIETALNEIFRHLAERGAHSVAIPLLCTKYGQLPVKRFLSLFKNTLQRASLNTLKRVWLEVPRGRASSIIGMLDSI